MLYVEKGKDLPGGTPLYCVRTTCNQFSFVRIIKDNSLAYVQDYIFDPNDGLWATEFVRAYWKREPQYHPHCALFYLLYKKLEL